MDTAVEVALRCRELWLALTSNVGRSIKDTRETGTVKLSYRDLFFFFAWLDCFGIGRYFKYTVGGLCRWRTNGWDVPMCKGRKFSPRIQAFSPASSIRLVPPRASQFSCGPTKTGKVVGVYIPLSEVSVEPCGCQFDFVELPGGICQVWSYSCSSYRLSNPAELFIVCERFSRVRQKNSYHCWDFGWWSTLLTALG